MAHILILDRQKKIVHHLFGLPWTVVFRLRLMLGKLTKEFDETVVLSESALSTFNRSYFSPLLPPGLLRGLGNSDHGDFNQGAFPDLPEPEMGRGSLSPSSGNALSPPGCGAGWGRALGFRSPSFQSHLLCRPSEAFTGHRAIVASVFDFFKWDQISKSLLALTF